MVSIDEIEGDKAKPTISVNYIYIFNIILPFLMCLVKQTQIQNPKQPTKNTSTLELEGKEVLGPMLVSKWIKHFRAVCAKQFTRKQ